MSNTNVATINRSVQNSAKNAHNARASSAAGRERVGKDDRDEAEADEAEPDERVVDPEQLPDERRQRHEMPAHADDLSA